jgi:hypothetical protein
MGDKYRGIARLAPFFTFCPFVCTNLDLLLRLTVLPLLKVFLYPALITSSHIFS